MQGDEDPKLFSAPVEGKLNVLASLGILTSDREVVRLITRRLPSEFYDTCETTDYLDSARYYTLRYGGKRPCFLRSPHDQGIGGADVGGGRVGNSSAIGGPACSRRWRCF